MFIPAGILYFGPSAIRFCGGSESLERPQIQDETNAGILRCAQNDNQKQVRDDNQNQVGGYGRDWPRDWRADLMPRAAALAGSILRAAATSVAESGGWLACRARRGGGVGESRGGE